MEDVATLALTINQTGVDGFQVYERRDAQGDIVEVRIFGATRRADFSTNGRTGNDLRRTTQLDGQNVTFNSGHAYNRSHAGGDVSQIGTMDEVESAILNDISNQNRLGN